MTTHSQVDPDLAPMRLAVQAKRALRQHLRFNANHDEKGRFSSGSTAGSTAVDLAAVTQPLAILGTSAPSAEVMDYLQKNGAQVWTAKPLPDGVERGPAKQCYMNASGLVINDPSLRYAEGIVYDSQIGPPGGLAILHAWAVTPEGDVIDPTLPHPETNVYYGVAYDTAAYSEHMLATGYYGVLGNGDEAARATLAKGSL